MDMVIIISHSTRLQTRSHRVSDELGTSLKPTGGRPEVPVLQCLDSDR